MTYKFESLHISKPIKIIGKPETVLEIDGGSIYIDFAQDEQAEDKQAEDNHDEEEVSVPNAPASNLLQAMRETLKTHALNRGTPLTKI